MSPQDSSHQTAHGSYIAQADHGSTATVSVVQLGPVPEIDLPAARARLAALPADSLAPITTLPTGSALPFAINPLFCGRDGALRALAQAFKAWADPGMPTVAISGIGGVGKSQLAVEFSHRYGTYFVGGVYWVSFAEAGAIAGEIVRVCAGLPDLPPGFQELDQPTRLDLILHAWCSDLPRLLIFDNCEDEAVLEQWRPTTGGAWVLLTTRRDRFDVALGVQVQPLPTLARPDSVLLLEKLSTSQAQPSLAPAPQPAALAAIAEELGDLPLALHVAGSYLNTYAGAVTPEAYLERLRKTPLDPALARAVGRSPTRHDLSVARTFALSYDRLNPSAAADRLALDLLSRAACFAPGEPLPRDLLTATLGLDADDPEAALSSMDAYRQLAELGLLATGHDGEPYLHRLLARFVVSLQAGVTAQAAVEEAVLAEAAQFNRAGDPRPLLAWQVHLRHITDRALTRGDEEAAGLANEVGYHLKAAGDLSGAKPYYERSLAICEQVLGERHPNTATSLNNLGILLHAMGDLSGASPYYERSLAIREQVLGEQHPDTATSLNNLGVLLQDMGDLSGAKPYYERSLAIREQVLGAQHPDTATGLNNLGLLLQDMGDYAGAKPYHERSLAIREQVLGEQHPDTAQSFNNLGSLLYAMGDYAGARPYYERSLAIYEQVLGERHPNTATGLNNLGLLLYDMGDLSGAKPYLERSLAIREQVLGGQHPDTAGSLNNLGLLLKDMGDLSGARQYLERSLAICEQVLGERHPNAATILNNLGILLQDMGDLSGARPYLERSLAIREQVLGAQHPSTASSLNNLGLLLQDMGDHEQAKAYLERALNSYTATLGAKHPETQAVRHILDELAITR